MQSKGLQLCHAFYWEMNLHRLFVIKAKMHMISFVFYSRHKIQFLVKTMQGCPL